jgi:hypothetical protein
MSSFRALWTPRRWLRDANSVLTHRPLVRLTSFTDSAIVPDSSGPLALSLGAAAHLFIAAKAAEGASGKTVVWYQMVTARCVRHFGASRPLDAISAPERRLWPTSTTDGDPRGVATRPPEIDATRGLEGAREASSVPRRCLLRSP